VQETMQHIENECKPRNEEDWNSITDSRLQELGVKIMISHFGGLSQALARYRLMK